MLLAISSECWAWRHKGLLSVDFCFLKVIMFGGLSPTRNRALWYFIYSLLFFCLVHFCIILAILVCVVCNINVTILVWLLTVFQSSLPVMLAIWQPCIVFTRNETKDSQCLGAQQHFMNFFETLEALLREHMILALLFVHFFFVWLPFFLFLNYDLFE